MIAQKIKQLYAALGGKHVEVRGGWITTNCPLAF